jgi:hypothetical protein
LHFLASLGTVDVMNAFEGAKMSGLDPQLQNYSGKTPMDVFESRLDKTEEHRDALYRVVESLTY